MISVFNFKEELEIMSNKKKLKRLADTNLKILKSGKIKVEKGQKVDITPFVKDSIEKSNVCRLHGLISQEDVSDKTIKTDITTNLLSPLSTAILTNRLNTNDVPTLVYAVTKKHALDIFSMIDDSEISALLRSSTLGAIYRELKPQWEGIIHDELKTMESVVMEIPKVMIYFDITTGEIKKNPTYINLLLIAVPNAKYIKKGDSVTGEEGLEKVSDEEKITTIVADMCDAIIKTGNKNVILNPFTIPYLTKHADTTAEVWGTITASQKFLENVRSAIFSINNENLYVLFTGTLNRLHGRNV